METQVETTAVAADVKKVSQKDAVFTFVTEAAQGLALEVGQTLRQRLALKDEEAKNVRKIVRQRLFAAVKSGEVRLGKQFDDSKLKKYCSGLINNWLKKDSRFN